MALTVGGTCPSWGHAGVSSSRHVSRTRCVHPAGMSTLMSLSVWHEPRCRALHPRDDRYPVVRLAHRASPSVSISSAIVPLVRSTSLHHAYSRSGDRGQGRGTGRVAPLNRPPRARATHGGAVSDRTPKPRGHSRCRRTRATAKAHTESRGDCCNRRRADWSDPSGLVRRIRRPTCRQLRGKVRSRRGFLRMLDIR